MLVLTRKCLESIIIGDDIKITILKSKSGEKGVVRLGISAPANINVDREEVYLKKTVSMSIGKEKKRKCVVIGLRRDCRVSDQFKVNV